MEHFALQGLSVQYKGKTLLHNISFEVHQGDTILIQGASGAGKSTLLKAIMGFARECTGKMFMNGRLIDAATIRDLRKHCAYIGQKPLGFQGTVRDYLELPFTFKHNKANKPDKHTCLNMLASLGLAPDIMSSDYAILSGGEQQRLTIAQALLLGRDVYLLDEITSCLDESNTLRVINLLTASKDRTLLVVSHKTAWEDHANRIITLEQGHMHEKRARP